MTLSTVFAAHRRNRIRLEGSLASVEPTGEENVSALDFRRGRETKELVVHQVPGNILQKGMATVLINYAGVKFPGVSASTSYRGLVEIIGIGVPRQRLFLFRLPKDTLRPSSPCQLFDLLTGQQRDLPSLGPTHRSVNHRL